MTTDELQKRKPNNRARPKSGRALKIMPIYLCLLPGLLFLFVFSYYPFFSAFYFSLFKWDGVNSAYIGIQNFINISHDDRLVPAVKNIVNEVIRLRKLSPLWEMAQEGVDISKIKWAAH